MEQLQQYTGIVWIVIMFVVLYFFMIRPTQKRQKEVSSMQSSLQKGDAVVTIGGLHGIIDAIEDKTIFLKCADGTRLQFERTAIGRVVSEQN